MNFQQQFRMKFEDRFSFLNLKNVVVNRAENLCTITFLYPSTHENLTEADKQEITDFLGSILDLQELKLKVKFLKVYLEEKLILKQILQIFEDKFKLLKTYITENNIQIEIGNLDAQVKIKVSPRLSDFFANNKVVAYLGKVLKDSFLTDFVITLQECDDVVEEVDIEKVPLKSYGKKAQRYDVMIIKDIVGENITPKPEYLSYINAPKSAVIVAGFIDKLERHDFVIKKGAKAGQQKAYFTFTITDGKGKIDCMYFCPKKHERDLDALENTMYLLLHGDVRLGLTNKLTLYVDKMALASEIEKTEEKETEEEDNSKAVEIVRLGALEQENMFGGVDKYNGKIMGKNIVVFDVETTGLDPQSDQIIELGAVKIENGNIVERFSTFVKPTKEIPYDVTELTGITNEMVDDAPPIEKVIREFYEFSKGCILSGHNIINFDIKFVRRFGDLQNLNFNNDLIDTMNEARVARLKISRFNLGTVTKALGIELVGAHRAWNDAFATAQVLLKLNEVK